MGATLFARLQGLVTLGSSDGTACDLGNPFGRHSRFCQAVTKRMPEVVGLQVANARELRVAGDEIMDSPSGNWLIGIASGSI